MSDLVEQVVTFKVGDFTFAGKIDRVEGARLTDYKGVSSISDFIDKKAISYQTELYAEAVKLALDIEIEEIEYRLIERPSIRFCGKDKGDIEFYERRCRQWLRDNNSLREIVVPVNKESRDKGRGWIKMVAERIQENRRKHFWMPNEMACQDWNRTCEYLPLCRAAKYGHDVMSLIEKDYVVLEERHPELSRNDMNTVTYSLGSMFCQCETKMFWRYEKLLSPRGQVSSEAMYIGKVMHLGVETLARGGLEAARAAITDWGSKQKVIGLDMKKKRDEMLAKSRAMVCAASEKWFGVEVEDIDLTPPGDLVPKKRKKATKRGAK